MKTRFLIIVGIIALIGIIQIPMYFEFTSQPSDYSPEIARMAEGFGDDKIVGVTCEKGWFTEQKCTATTDYGKIIDWPIETAP